MFAATNQETVTEGLPRPGAAIAGGSEISNRGWLRRPVGMVAVAVLFVFALGVGQRTQAQTFSLLHTFTGQTGGGDGASSYARLVMDSAGNLYGTTVSGGNINSSAGTVFKIDASNNETVLYSFTAGNDGGFPIGGLTVGPGGILYGTTAAGGTKLAGTVFELDPNTMVETVLWNFTGGNDGGSPASNLVMDSAGNLYGTTAFGGSLGNGNVFELNPSTLVETSLHDFGGLDGALPFSGLVMDSGNNLYGTTTNGGANSGGVVFKMDHTGTETNLYTFTGYSTTLGFVGPDGASPQSDLVMDSLGNLYGTTVSGGNINSSAGTVFKIDSSFGETVLHSFGGPGDGSQPNSGLVKDSAGNFYGSTAGGGASNDGTVYKIDASGNETVIHSFSGDDGISPIGSLIVGSDGNLYGTTSAGGTSGYGTVFKIAFVAQFSSMSVKLDTTSGPPPGFDLKALVTQGSGAAAIDPVAQGMTLTVGTYTVTIPAGSFHLTNKGTWVYKGTINGVALQARILQTGTNTYQVQVDASGVDLTSLTNPVTVTLALGTNTGTTQVNR